jgi:hypothetical protein
MRRLGLIILAVLAGCADKERTPVMGHWTGGFYADNAEVLRGYLQLYRTGDKFKMRLASKDQEFEFDGTWTIAKRRIELRVSDIKFENPPEETARAMKLFVLDADKVRAAYAKPITLDIDATTNTLTGLTMTIDKIQGKHRFSKGAVTPDAQKALDKMDR